LSKKLTDEKLIQFEKKKCSDAVLEKVRLILRERRKSQKILQLDNLNVDFKYEYNIFTLN